MSQPEKVRAVVWGAGGYVGGELLRLVVTHPALELTAALSATHGGRSVGKVHPSLAPWTDLAFSAPNDWDWNLLAEGPWAVFASLAHGETMAALPPLLNRLADADVRWVDLSGDFRLKSAADYTRFYGRTHASSGMLGRFAYGLPELNRERITGTRLVANPGCFATGAQLAILPAAAAKVPLVALAIDGKTGSSGAGVTPRETTHHPNRANNFRAYKVLEHQHFPEILAGFHAAGGSEAVEVSFAPQMAPMVRGIFTTAHLFLEEPVPAATVRGWYESFYAGHPFVRLVEDSPGVADVWGTNRCDISLTVSGRRVVVCTAIDNLVKGAAGQAIQNANLMHGWAETTGLTTPAPFPV